MLSAKNAKLIRDNTTFCNFWNSITDNDFKHFILSKHNFFKLNSHRLKRLYNAYKKRFN